MHGRSETVNADLIDGPLAHLPSGVFAANAAWLACAAITHNVLRPLGCLGSAFPPERGAPPCAVTSSASPPASPGTDEPADGVLPVTSSTCANTTRVYLVTASLTTGRVEGLRCGPAWCAGTRGEDATVQRSDGSWNRVRQGLRGYPYQDRFLVGSGEIYDARSDTTVTFEGTKLPSGGRQWSTGSGVIFWTQDGGVGVVNLAAVP